jgi:NAD(P)-dependent dehydrogenase (short-subunit alcohol dehydrogenase family)
MDSPLILLENKIALVTGAGSGIGRQTALVMAREGAAVVVSDVNEEGGHETVDMVSQAGGEAHFIAADVSQESEVAALVDGTVARYGRLDCAHNNAGIGGPLVPLADYPTDEFDRVLSVNLRGVFLSMRYQLAHMLPRGAGSIVNTASTFGLVAFPQAPGYVATKHAVVGLTKAGAIENAASGIRINAVCPGAIRTPMVEGQAETLSPGAPDVIFEQLNALAPIGRLGEPQEIGEAVAWLSSDAASFVTGTAMVVDGGWTAR